MVDWRQVHDEAVARGARAYRDPATGYQVFTELGLLERGRCCGAGCRHCPYGHLGVVRVRERPPGLPTWRVVRPDPRPLSWRLVEGVPSAPVSDPEGVVAVVLHPPGADLRDHEAAARRLGIELLTVAVEDDGDGALAAAREAATRRIRRS